MDSIMKNIYISPTGSQSGKSAIALGLMGLLRAKIAKVAFFRPIISQINAERKDHDIELLRSYYKLNFDYEECYACTLSEARALLNAGQHDVLMEKILRKYNEIAEKSEFVLCEGTDFLGKEITFEFDLNADIAANLGASLVLIANATSRSPEELASTFQTDVEMCSAKGVDVLTYIFNMSTLDDKEKESLLGLIAEEEKEKTQLYVIPTNDTLGRPTMGDIKGWLNAKVLYGHDKMDALVSDYLIAAMQVNNFMEHIKPGNLVLTPGDRSDILLGALTSRLSSEYPEISGILLTGGLELPSSIHKLISGWQSVPAPILSVEHHTYKTISILRDLHGKIEAHDERKINMALALFERSIDTYKLSDSIIKSTRSEKKTPMMFEFQIMEQARKKPMRIVLPEGSEERILRATEILLQRKVAEIILLGDAQAIRSKASEYNLDITGAEVIEPAQSPYFTDFVNSYYEIRKHKGMTEEMARDRMLDTTYFGTMMVHKNLADGMVSGSVNTTAHTVRPALEFIKTKPGFSIVSSVFFMCLKDKVLAFGDCAINPDPNAEQLAEIAIVGAQTAKTFGLEPRVALLSYSTGSSGAGADVEKVIQATKIAKERAPELLIEGPIQYDAAIDPEVAKTKLPNSEVAGRATVFIFPDLNTGNNTYKAVQRAADAVAVGPVLQGLNKPVNDLSRGCTVADIVNTVAITAMQAQVEQNK